MYSVTFSVSARLDCLADGAFDERNVSDSSSKISVIMLLQISRRNLFPLREESIRELNSSLYFSVDGIVPNSGRISSSFSQVLGGISSGAYPEFFVSADFMLGASVMYVPLFR